MAEKYKLEHIDMGKFLREVAKQDTPLGKEVYHIQNVTKTLVPSRILEEVLRIKLNSLQREQGVLFEGVPRAVDQAEYFEKALQESGRKIDAVIYINIPAEESIERIGKRWTCKKCGLPLIMEVDIQKPTDVCPKCGGEVYQRLDDSPEGVKKRLKVFQEETIPVIEHYRKKGILIEIDGRPSIEKINENIIKELEKKIND